MYSSWITTITFIIDTFTGKDPQTAAHDQVLQHIEANMYSIYKMTSSIQ